MELVSRMHRRVNLRFATSTIDVIPLFLLVLWIYFCPNDVIPTAFVSSKLYYSWKLRILYFKSTGDHDVCATSQGGRKKNEVTPCNIQQVFQILVKQEGAGIIKVTKTIGIYIWNNPEHYQKRIWASEPTKSAILLPMLPMLPKKWAKNTEHDVLTLVNRCLLNVVAHLQPG